MLMSSPMPTEMWLGIGCAGRMRQVHDEKARPCHVVDMQEFAPGHAGAPDHDLPGARPDRPVETPDQRRQDLGVLGVQFVP